MSGDEKSKGSPIKAAGGLLWRRTPEALKIVVVNRSRYGGDWSLPKGKLKPGESWLEAALREVKEETGHDVRTLSFAGAIAYLTEKGPKIVRFWNMAVSGVGRSNVDVSEVAKVTWLLPSEAMERLSYTLERAMVEAWESEIIPAGLV
jgi:8-oxo-dGTP pyrophosphatase MutT (NUDIX family)